MSNSNVDRVHRAHSYKQIRPRLFAMNFRRAERRDG